MKRLRFSLTALLVVISLVAVACAALLAGSELWASVLCGLAVLTLGLSTLAALVRRGPARAFWIGCAVFGWGYWCFGHETDGQGTLAYYRTTWLGSTSDGLTSGLPTTKILLWLHDHTATSNISVGSQVQVQYGGPGLDYPAQVTDIGEDGQVQILWQGYSSGTEEWVAASRVRSGDRTLYFTAGHSLFLLLAALAGGLLGKFLRGLPELPPLASGKPSASAPDNQPAAVAVGQGSVDRIRAPIDRIKLESNT